MGELRDWTQTYAASSVREALDLLKARLPDGELITDALVDELTATVLDSSKYKPGDGRAFYSIIQKRTGFTVRRFDCCRRSCVSFAKYPDLDYCPRCGESRWESDRYDDETSVQLVDDDAFSSSTENGDHDQEVQRPTKAMANDEDIESQPGIDKTAEKTQPSKKRKRKAAKTHVYFPIQHRLLLWYTSRYLSCLMTTYKRKAAALQRKGVITDFWNAEIYEELVNDGKFLDDRELAFCCGFDGTKAFRIRKNRFVWPIILTCINFPPEMRFKRRNVIVVGVVPGPNGPKEPDSFLKPMIDEFKLLSDREVRTWDAGTQENFTLHAHLVMVSTDMSARTKLMRLMGFQSSSYCEYCKVCSPFCTIFFLCTIVFICSLADLF